jgi:hypothetical protein
METERLVERLTAELTPVRRLARPGVRLAWWLLISVPAAGLVAWGFGLRPDLAARLADRTFLVAEGAALLTALVGIYAALCAGLPDQPGWKVWLPVAPMALWLAVLGRQCLDVFLRLGPQGLSITPDAMCLPAIALGGIVPALAIAVMLRRSGKFRTTHACLCGALGAAALGAAALRLYHMEDAAIMVLVWQLGSVALFSLVAGAISRVVVDNRPDHILRVRS